MIAIGPVELSRNAPPVRFDLGPGRWAIIGPAGSGKSKLLKQIAKALADQEEVFAVPGLTKRRQTLRAWALGLAGRGNGAAVAGPVSALGLWDSRTVPVSTLSPSQKTAASLLPLMLRPASTWLIDGTLDTIDPWQLEGFLQGSETASGVVAVTHRLEIAERFENVIVLKRGALLFAGPKDELMNRTAPATVRVRTEDPSTITSIAEPFRAEIERFAGELVLTTGRQAELAARLLTEGYGAVDLIVTEPPSFAAAVDNIVASALRTGA